MRKPIEWKVYQIDLPDVLPGYPDYQIKVPIRHGQSTATSELHALTRFLHRKSGNVTNRGTVFYPALADNVKKYVIFVRNNRKKPEQLTLF